MIQRTYSLKNMISKSCIAYIKLYFDSVEGVQLQSVKLGEVVVQFDPQIIKEEEVIEHFDKIGFNIISDRDSLLVEKVRIAAIELIMLAENKNSLIRNSDYISDKVEEPYDKISKVFSRQTGTTLEKFIILLKIEKAKEMILRDELTLSEIAYQLGYSSVQYLSRQFKQISGYTFSEFKELADPPLIPVEDLI